MNAAEKAQTVAALNEKLGESGAVVVCHYKGLTVAEITDFRSRLRELGGSFTVAKNTLAKLALKGTDYEGLDGLFTGPTGIAVSNDPVTAAKVAYDYAKDNDKLVIIGGGMGANVLDEKGVEALAKLPSLDELRSKLVGLLQAPATKIARVMQAPAQQMVGVTQAYGQSQ